MCALLAVCGLFDLLTLVFLAWPACKEGCSLRYAGYVAVLSSFVFWITAVLCSLSTCTVPLVIYHVHSHETIKINLRCNVGIYAAASSWMRFRVSDFSIVQQISGNFHREVKCKQRKRYSEVPFRLDCLFIVSTDLFLSAWIRRVWNPRS